MDFIRNMCLKIARLKWYPYLPEASDLHFGTIHCSWHKSFHFLCRQIAISLHPVDGRAWYSSGPGLINFARLHKSINQMHYSLFMHFYMPKL